MEEAITSQPRPNFTDREKRALLALWSVAGIGPRTLDAIRGVCDGNVGNLLEVRPSDWFNAPGIRPEIRIPLAEIDTLARRAEEVEAAARRSGMRVCWQSDVDYPERLLDVRDAPPLLFYQGAVGVPRRRVGMVGSRHVQPDFLRFVRQQAAELARMEVGIVSGGAIGIDRVCHLGALDAKGETWAFFGSALDALDPAQKALAPQILSGGGVLWSEFPPGVRASETTFPRRNRLISGSSDATWVLRAGNPSGALHTAKAALQQGRQLWACPGDPQNDACIGSNEMLGNLWAKPVYLASQAYEHLRPKTQAEVSPKGVQVSDPSLPPAELKARLDDLSQTARTTYLALPRALKTFEEVMDSTQLGAAKLMSALSELELSGLVMQHPGRVYEKL